MQAKCLHASDTSSNKTTTTPKSKLDAAVASEDANDDDDWIGFGALCHNGTSATLDGKLAAVQDSPHGWASFGALCCSSWLLGQLIVLVLTLLFPCFCCDCQLLLFEREKLCSCWTVFRINMDMFVRKHLGGHSFDRAHRKHRAKFKHKRKELFDWRSCSLLFSHRWLGKNLKKPLDLLLSVDTWFEREQLQQQRETSIDVCLIQFLTLCETSLHLLRLVSRGSVAGMCPGARLTSLSGVCRIWCTQLSLSCVRLWD